MVALGEQFELGLGCDEDGDRLAHGSVAVESAVEFLVDETYIGGDERNWHASKTARPRSPVQVVLVRSSLPAFSSAVAKFALR